MKTVRPIERIRNSLPPLGGVTVFNVLPCFPNGFHTVFNVSVALFDMWSSDLIAACWRGLVDTANDRRCPAVFRMYPLYVHARYVLRVGITNGWALANSVVSCEQHPA